MKATHHKQIGRIPGQKVNTSRAKTNQTVLLCGGPGGGFGGPGGGFRGFLGSSESSGKATTIFFENPRQFYDFL